MTGGRTTKRATGHTAFSEHGFTLVEILVVLGIFSTISVAVTDIYLLATRAERRVDVEQGLQGNARTALDFITRSIRNGSIAYDLMPSPIPSPVDQITVRTRAGTLFEFFRSADAQLCGTSSPPCLMVREGAAQSAALSPAGMVVEDLRFFVSPPHDPFLFDGTLGTYAADAQPTVTIVLILAQAGKSAARVQVQTTITTRQYVR